MFKCLQMKYGLSCSYSVAIIFTVTNLMKKMQSERNNLGLPIKHISVKNSSWQEVNYLAQQIQALFTIEQLIKKQNALNINNNGNNNNNFFA